MVKRKCPFCCVENKFTHTYFSDVGEEPCSAWIDYAKDSKNRFLWYAVLNGDQYTKGHSLVILGSHRYKITDCSLTRSELSALAAGLKKVASRLKETLGVEAVHVLSLCEGVEHLHYHLIPRYSYTCEEKQFVIKNYWQREKKDAAVKKAQYISDIKSNERKIHGMWYAAYHEMKFKDSAFWRLPVQERVRELEDRAKRLRDPKLRCPF